MRSQMIGQFLEQIQFKKIIIPGVSTLENCALIEYELSGFFC